MTPEQASKLRKGDHILVEMVVKEDEHNYLVAVYMPHLLGVKSLAVAPSDIHSILPRPLEAGDRVKCDDADNGTTLTVFEQWAFVKWDNQPMPEVYYLSDLQRVEEDQ